MNKVIAIYCDLCDEYVDEWKGCVCGLVACWDCISWVKDTNAVDGGQWLCRKCKAELIAAQKSET
jgi:hypothetical protein